MYELNHFEMIRVQNGLAQEHWDNSIGPGGTRKSFRLTVLPKTSIQLMRHQAPSPRAAARNQVGEPDFFQVVRIRPLLGFPIRMRYNRLLAEAAVSVSRS